MRVAFFVHSLLSDWNHGNAHFLRGVASELIARGHDVRVFEPRDAWSLQTRGADLVVKASGVGVFDELRQASPPASASSKRRLLSLLDRHVAA